MLLKISNIPFLVFFLGFISLGSLLQSVQNMYLIYVNDDLKQ